MEHNLDNRTPNVEEKAMDEKIDEPKRTVMPASGLVVDAPVPRAPVHEAANSDSSEGSWTRCKTYLARLLMLAKKHSMGKAGKVENPYSGAG